MPDSPLTKQPMQPYLRDYGQSTLFRCRSTGLLVADPLPTAEQLNEYYQSAYFEGSRYESEVDSEDNHYLKNWQRRLDRIESLLSDQGKPLTMLDIGAGTGAFVQLASQRDWKVSCVEYSESGRETIQQRVPAIEQIEAEFRPEDFPGKQFDLVSMWAVIEHLPYHPDRIPSLFEIIRPGGLVAFSFPNPATVNRYLFRRNWRYFIPVEHLTFYPPSLFRKLLTQAGFELIHETSSFSSAACQDGMDRSIASSLPSIGKKVITRLIRWTNALMFHGDTYEVIARRPVNSKAAT